MAEIQPPSYMQEACTTAQLDRLAWSSIICAEGVADKAGGDLRVTPGEPGLTVNVAAGQAWIQGESIADQGMYGVYSNGTKPLVLNTANPTDARIDLIVATIRDSQYSGTDNDWIIQVAPGTASPSPAPPPVPTSSIVLAQILVPAGATSITSGNITDTRVQAQICPQYESTTPLWKGSFVTATGTNISSGAWYVPPWTDQYRVEMTRLGRTISVTRAGVYRATANFMWGINANGVRRVQILLNPANNETADGGVGGTVLVDQTEAAVTGAGFGTTVDATTTVVLAVGDRLTTQGFQSSGVTLTVGLNGPIGTFFSVEYLGPAS